MHKSKSKSKAKARELLMCGEHNECLVTAVLKNKIKMTR